MKKLMLLLHCSFCFISLNAQEKTKATQKTNLVKAKNELKDCGEYKGHKLYKGAKGGCYYKDRSSKTKKLNKVYVEGNLCNC